MDINEFNKQAEAFYKALNEWVSEESVNKLTDIAYPNHDGKQDADVVATMFSLRDTLHGIEQGCKMGIGNLSIIIDTDN